MSGTPPPTNSNRSVSSNLSIGSGKGHHHSHSHSGLGLPTSISTSALSAVAAGQGEAGNASKFRSSVDGPRSVSATLGTGRPSNRPASEMLAMGAVPGNAETEAIDRWFEDLQHYEATLEEMAAASLDQNFKEELTAIEQWFHVLSAAERTAALYSLLQSSTPVQIRFFITVLQQLARNDPDNPMLSPTNLTSSMENQMEAKLAAMNFKSPNSPALQKFGRTSLGPGSAVENYLSPKSARLDDANAAATLEQQRAKLKAQAHRISAPGTLSATGNSLKSPLWTPNETVAERRSPSPSGQRPKSTGSDISGNSGNNTMRSPYMNLEDQLSPMLGNNWSSMVNTPLVPMFTESNSNQTVHDGPLSPGLDLPGANTRLAGWSSQQPSNIVLDDAKKFRRSGRGAEILGSSQSMFNGRRSTSGAQPMRSTSGTSPNLSNSTLASQQAALSAQANWRNVNGLLTPNTAGSQGGSMTPADMANALVQQQQMMQAQLQLQQNLMMNGMMMNGLMSPNLGLMNMPMGSLSPSLGGASARRSPRPDGRFGQRTPNLAQGSGANAEEPVDDALLNDIPAWLRSLRLHKYTPNFENCKWQDIVQMDDGALEAKGVSALGARRKLLKVFENVRIAKGLQEKGTASLQDATTPEPDHSADLDEAKD